MIKFDDDKVLLLHQILLKETGGAEGVRDYGLLNSALNEAYATFDGKEIYPSKQEKGARLGFSLVSNHAFVDGNKRIGMYVMLTFFEVNGIIIEATNEEVAKVGIALASGKMEYADLLLWVREHDQTE